eukprot:10704156-Lingulodinium_polyedra.AAC.1
MMRRTAHAPSGEKRIARPTRQGRLAGANLVDLVRQPARARRAARGLEDDAHRPGPPGSRPSRRGA